MRRANRLWMCLSPVAIAIADVLVTLHGQPPGYWAGSYGEVREDNPLARYLLTTHPGAFLAANLAWMGSVALGILLLPLRAARCVAFAVLLGQAAAVCTWLLPLRLGIVWAALLLLLVRLLIFR